MRWPPGSGPTKAAPLTITLPGQPPLTATLMVVQTASDYTLNAVDVAGVPGQALRNVPVALLTGPQNANYTATINWGDGETSVGQITALGGGQYVVTGSKPTPYATVGTRYVIVTATGPGAVPAPPLTTFATIFSPSVSTPPGNDPGGPPPPIPVPPRGIRAKLVRVKVGKKIRLMIAVYFTDNGSLQRRFVSPYQTPNYKNIRLLVAMTPLPRPIRSSSDHNGLHPLLAITQNNSIRLQSSLFTYLICLKSR